MNINPVSFGQNYRHQINVPVTNAENFDSQYVKRDYYEKAKAQIKNTAGKCLTTGLLAGMIISQLYGCSAKKIDEHIHNSVVIPYSDSVSLEETAEIYDVNPEFIEEFNKLNESDDMPETIKIPERIDLTEDKINEVREKLYKDNLSDEKKAEYILELSELEDKKAVRDEIAEVYGDEFFTYFFLKENINVEDFKEIFGIKDGRIKANNKLDDYGWGPYDPDMGTYKDYTKCVLHAGDIIKISNINSLKD